VVIKNLCDDVMTDAVDRSEYHHVWRLSQPVVDVTSTAWPHTAERGGLFSVSSVCRLSWSSSLNLFCLADYKHTVRTKGAVEEKIKTLSWKLRINSEMLRTRVGIGQSVWFDV